MKRIGLFISESKNKKMDFVTKLKECTRNREFEIIKIDPNSPFEDQGPFDLIIHKLTDIQVMASIGDEQSKILFQKFMDYTDSHPETVILNPTSSVNCIIDRKLQYQVIVDSGLVHIPGNLFIPAFVDITNNNIDVNRTKLRDSNVKYPIICKPMIAQGTSFCHEMSLIFCDDGLKDLKPPCIVQSFINHDAALFKAFVVGDYISIVRRPSLKNQQAGNYPTIPFNSHHISKPDSNHFLIVSDEKTVPSTSQHMECESLKKIMKDLQQVLNLDLFGVDVIIEQGTGRYAVIDVNVFPGYEGVPMFMEKLVEYMDFLLNHKVDGRVNDGNLHSHDLTNTLQDFGYLKHKKLRLEKTDNFIQNGVDSIPPRNSSIPDKDGPQKRAVESNNLEQRNVISLPNKIPTEIQRTQSYTHLSMKRSDKNDQTNIAICQYPDDMVQVLQ